MIFAIILIPQLSYGFFPFLRCDGLGDSKVSPSYCRVCFATNTGGNSRLCSKPAFDQSPDVQLLSQSLEDDFSYNMEKLKRLPAEGFNVFKRMERNACVDSFTELEFVEKQIEYLKAKRDMLMNQMITNNCGPQQNQVPSVERIPASTDSKIKD